MEKDNLVYIFVIFLIAMGVAYKRSVKPFEFGTLGVMSVDETNEYQRLKYEKLDQHIDSANYDVERRKEKMRSFLRRMGQSESTIRAALISEFGSV